MFTLFVLKKKVRFIILIKYVIRILHLNEKSEFLVFLYRIFHSKIEPNITVTMSTKNARLNKNKHVASQNQKWLDGMKFSE